MKNLLTIGMAAMISFSLGACSAKYQDIVLPQSVAGSEIEIKTLSEWVGRADHIIVGTVMAHEEFGTSYPKYTIKVENQLKGEVSDDTIDVFPLEWLSEENSRYVLFLNAFESEYYPRTSYSVLNTPNAIAGDKLTSGPYQDQSLEQFIKDIQASPGLKQQNESKRNVVERADSLQALIEASDYVAHVRPLEIRVENKAIRDCTVEIMNLYKGDKQFLSREALVLPRSVEPNQEYLVFFQLSNPADTSERPGITLTTRHGSVLTASDKEWEEALRLLQAGS